MPSAPVDYYAELEVERSASEAEITAAYRRLARICHPDKNPDNIEEATARFQRLQAAYETLSDRAKRSHYDATSRPASSFSSRFASSRGSAFDAGFFWREGPFGEGPFGENVYSFARRDKETDGSSRGARLRAQVLRAVRLAKEAEKKAEAVRKAKKQSEEKLKQEARWKHLGAVAKDERRNTCLHSAFCTKTRHSKKFKCSACSVKRGMIAFECPHCAAELCQFCVLTFESKREREDKLASTKKGSGAAGDEEASQGTGDKEKDGSEKASSIPSQKANPMPNSVPGENEKAGDSVGATEVKENAKAKATTPGFSTAKMGAVQGDKFRRVSHKPVIDPSPDGPDPGYEETGNRHLRCGFLHKGGDTRCYVVHPELRPQTRGVRKAA